MTKSLTKRIGFYYPSNQIGGAQILIFRYFSFLLEKGIDVYLITESKDEIYYSLVTDFTHILLIDEFVNNSKSNNWIVVIPIPLFFQIKIKNIFKGITLIAWLMHPGLIVGQIDKRCFLKYFSKIRLKVVVENLSNKNSLWFLDNECYSPTQKELGLNIHPVYMPLLLNYDDIPNINLNKSNNFSIAFVQRAVKSKLVLAQLLLEELTQKYSHIIKDVDIHFVGEGSNKIVLKDYSKHFNSVNFHTNMTNSDLIYFLNKNIDITVAMGQTALDAAFSGNVPIVIDFVVGNFQEREFKFNFLYENENLSLGGFYSKKSYSQKKNNIVTLVSLIEDKILLAEQKKLAQKHVLETYFKSDEKLQRLIFLLESASFRHS